MIYLSRRKLSNKCWKPEAGNCTLSCKVLPVFGKSLRLKVEKGKTQSREGAGENLRV
jgi:hypothetical protein